MGSTAAAPPWDIRGGCELLFQRVQVSGAPMTWASLLGAASVALEARASPECGGRVQAAQPPGWGLFLDCFDSLGLN